MYMAVSLTRLCVSKLVEILGGLDEVEMLPMPFFLLPPGVMLIRHYKTHSVKPGGKIGAP